MEPVEPGGGEWAVRPKWPTTPSPAGALAVGRLQVGTVHLAPARLLVSSVAPAATGGDLAKFLDVHVEQLAETCSTPVHCVVPDPRSGTTQ